MEGDQEDTGSCGFCEGEGITFEYLDTLVKVKCVLLTSLEIMLKIAQSKVQQYVEVFQMSKTSHRITNFYKRYS